MTCDGLRDWLRTAAPHRIEEALRRAERHPGHPVPVAEEARPAPSDRLDEAVAHLAVCGPCRDAAAAVLEDRTLLADAIAEALRTAPEPDPTAIVDRWRATVPPGAGGIRAVSRRRHPLPLALLAAASLAAVLVTRPGTPDALPGTPVTSVSRPEPDVVAHGSRNVAVLPTRNPDITVLWYYESQP